jgi:leucyl aminopeptidase
MPTITYQPPALAKKSLDSLDHLILLTAPDLDAVRGFPYGETIGARMHRASRKPDAEPFVTELPNAAATRVALAAVKPDVSAFDLLALARQLVARQREANARRLALATVGLEPALAARALEVLLSAALAVGMALPSFKSKRDDKPALTEVVLCSGRAPAWLARALAEARGNHLARSLTVLPPNELTPTSYRQRVEQLARRYRWQTRFYDLKQLKKLGAGAFLAVAQGSPEPDAGILHLRYRPAKASKRTLALVGKGICFDTGGTNLKPARHMHGMHEDMEGSAVALGTLQALTELKAGFNVDCWLALAQNHIGPRAYRQNEVVTAANGTTIEVMHTDAEGRMVLADTLTLATRTKPTLVIDYATLTGACVAALGTRMSGAFTNRDWLPILVKSGIESGERVWPFPLPEDYETLLKSEIADIKQCVLENEADHILAALFLKKFLAHDPAWIHIDLAAGNHKGGLAHVPSDVTGFGVRFTLNLLLDQKLLNQQQG